MDYTKENEHRDLWFKERAGDGWNCYFFPQGWADHFQHNGPAEAGELYGYAPTRTYADSPIETLCVRAECLLKMVETTAEEARKLHPRLAQHLDDINKAA